MAAPRGKAAGARGGRSLDGAALLRAAREGTLPPIVVMTGGERFSRERDLRALRAACSTEGLDEFNSLVLFGDDASGDAIVRHAETLPFGAPRRFVLVRRAGKLAAREMEAIARYAEAPSATTCLVFVCDEGKAPILTALSGNATVVTYAVPRDYQLAQWIQRQAANDSIVLDEPAARLIADLAGGSHIRAHAALELAAVGARAAGPRDKPRVTAALVATVVTGGPDENPFHLNDALLSREGARTVSLLRDRLAADDSGYALLGRLEAQLRRQMEMRAAVEAGATPRAVIQARSPMLPPAIKSRLVSQLESFDTQRLIEAMRLARKTDRAIKSWGSGNEAAHLEALLWRIVTL